MTRTYTHTPRWRTVLARLPLPALALSAAYGVYQFALLFSPQWVAVLTAASFELVYIGLAVAPTPPALRRRAMLIALAAVSLSAAYNVVAGLVHLCPGRLDGLTAACRPLWLDGVLSALHGIPLAVLAYAVAALLLHQHSDGDAQQPASIPEPGQQAAGTDTPALPASPERDDLTAGAGQPEPAAAALYQCDNCGAGLTKGQHMAMKRWGHCQHCKHSPVALQA